MHVFTGLPTTHSETGCCFSPDESLVLTGVSAQRDGTGGALLFFDVNKYAAHMPLLDVCLLHLMCCSSTHMFGFIHMLVRSYIAEGRSPERRV